MCIDDTYRKNIFIRILRQLLEFKIMIKAISIFDWNGLMHKKDVWNSLIFYISNNNEMEWINIQFVNGNKMINTKTEYEWINTNVQLTCNKRTEWLKNIVILNSA